MLKLWILNMVEKTTKYFLKLEQKQPSTKHIHCIETDDGYQLNSPDEILAEEKHFFYSKNMVFTKTKIREGNSYIFNLIFLKN